MPEIYRVFHLKKDRFLEFAVQAGRFEVEHSV